MIQETDDHIVVRASEIDNVHITYKCPFCYTIRNGRTLSSPICKKTGRVYTSAKSGEHRHGSGRDLSPRIEYRSSHCRVRCDKEIKIIIDEKTKGCEPDGQTTSEKINAMFAAGERKSPDSI